MRTAPIARCLTAALVSVAIPATALATPEVGGHDNGWSIADETYLRTYDRCWEALGPECGRNLLDYAWKGGEAPSEAQVERSTATMERWLNPPEPTVISSTSSAVVTAPATSTVAPASGGCTGMEAESGSLGYANNTNPDYVGCYQISTQHYGSGGICEGMGTDPASQDACAANICEEQGSGAWTNAAGANPC